MKECINITDRVTSLFSIQSMTCDFMIGSLKMNALWNKKV